MEVPPETTGLGPPQLLVTIHDSELKKNTKQLYVIKTDTSLYSTLYSTNLKEFSAQTKFSRELEKTLLPARRLREKEDANVAGHCG